MDTEDKASPADEGRRSSEGLGLEPERDDFGWHALNYRTAHTLHAEAMWQELAACVDRRVAAAVSAEREKWRAVQESRELLRGAARGALSVLQRDGTKYGRLCEQLRTALGA